MKSRRVVVIGGGVSGLAAAYSLASEFEVVVLDAAPRFGGKLKTASFRGRALDVGPDAFITRSDSAAVLCRDLGLSDELVAPATASAGIYARGALRPFPRGLVLGIPTDLGALSASKIVGPASVVRAALDLARVGRSLPPNINDLVRSGTFDPSVADVVGRRLGRSVLRNLVDPLIGGINASDVSTLSFASSVPRLVEMSAGKTSIMRALRPLAKPDKVGREESGTTLARPPVFLGLSRGLESLADRLVESLRQSGAELLASCPSTFLKRVDDSTRRFVVGLEGGEISADGVVLAVPGPAAGAILSGIDEEMAEKCAEIAYASVVTVTLAWRSSAVPDSLGRFFASLKPASVETKSSEEKTEVTLPGSGVLIPRGQGQLITAATFTSTKWPRSANPGEVVVRASAGRHLDERAVRLDDAALTAKVRRDLETVLGITDEPIDLHIERWPQSFPQYECGHAARVEHIERLAARYSGLSLCGAAFRGIGIPACIESGISSADQVRSALHGSASRPRERDDTPVGSLEPDGT